jgi:UDP-N-acetylmuramyl tripeptide synthase
MGAHVLKLGIRAFLATTVVRFVNALSRRLGRGEGTVIGGRLGLALDPGLLRKLAQGRQIALVSGTNGKTTTTALLRAGWGADVASNVTGANMPAGHVAALVASSARRVVLEVDEAWLPTVIRATDPAVVVLLNLSRDQLDRANEVRRVAQRWRDAFGDVFNDAKHGVLVANANDPLVAYAAQAALRIRWCAVRNWWNEDAVSCPVCTKPMTYEGTWTCACHGERAPFASWHCLSCGFSPPATVEAMMSTKAHVAGEALTLDLQIPGSFNEANALMALEALVVLGIDVHEALERMRQLRSVAGRFELRSWQGRTWRLLLAKNPAGFASLFDLVEGSKSDLVVAINANVADGRDPSWLYDAHFERLRGRRVWCSGERKLDLAARLYYGEVEFGVSSDEEIAASLSSTEAIDVIANYTAFASWYERSSPC